MVMDGGRSRFTSIACALSLAALLAASSPRVATAGEDGTPAERYARILVHHSLALKAGDDFVLWTNPAADELNRAVYVEALKAGAFVHVITQLPDQDEIFFSLANDAQLARPAPFLRWTWENADAILTIDAPANTRSLAGIPAARFEAFRNTHAPLFHASLERMERKELRMCGTVFPGHAMAQLQVAGTCRAGTCRAGTCRAGTCTCRAWELFYKDGEFTR